MIRIAITDDHTMFRKGLVSLIEVWEDVYLSFEASSGYELLQDLSQKPVDVVLLDLEMPGMSGLQTCEILRNDYPDLKILILTFLASPSEILRAIKIGADGYLTKNCYPGELREALTKLNDGGFYLEKSLQNLMDRTEQTSIKYNNKIEISQRELEITKLYALEYTGKQIAEVLGISIRTVESHKKNLMRKTNSKNFIGVILFALENKIVNFEDLRSY